MTKFYNVAKQKRVRRYLRKNRTKAERLLWSKLRNRQLEGLKFRRQYGILQYVVDFYCAEMKLAIEIDGDVHAYSDRARLDVLRQRAIEDLGIRVIRYTNSDVIESAGAVLDYILKNLPSVPSLKKEGESEGH